MSDKFNYVIGFRWNEAEPDSEIGTYSFFSSEVYFGTMEDAEEALLEVNALKGDNEHIYRIYKLVELT